MTHRGKAVRQVARAHHREHGFALVYLALVLVVLMIFAAIAVDIGLAKEAKASLQAAVDSAALTGAQILDTTKSTQAQNVFDSAATEAYKSMNLLSGSQTASMTGIAGSCGTNCDDYRLTSGTTTYDVQVTTPAVAPQGGSADQTLLNVKSCYGVPTTFGGVVGWKSIPICSSATAQNGVGLGGPTNAGCGTATDEFTSVSNTFDKAVGQQTIQAVYSSKFPLDTNSVHFVVQTQYGNFIQIPEGPGGTGSAGQSYSMNPAGGGTNVTFTYTLPNTIDTQPEFTGYGLSTIGTGSVFSNTFSANLQVIDQLGRQCGDASWSTCNPPKSSGSQAHDPVLDGGASGDVGGANRGWGTGANGANTSDDTSGETVKSPAPDHSTISGDGHDVDSDEYLQTRVPQSNPLTSDADDTITPSLGVVVSAGWPVGAIYNDEQPLDTAWTYLLIDGQQKAYSTSFSSDMFTFTDPSTVWQYPPKGTTAPSPIAGVPSFGAFSANVSSYRRSGNTVTFSILDNMGNPLPGENITYVSGGNGVTPPASTLTALNGSTGSYTFTNTPNGTNIVYTFAYSPAANAPQWGGPLYGGTLANESGTFTLTVTWASNAMTVTSGLGSANNAATWPNVQNDHTPGGSPAGGSVGVMYNTSLLPNGWHSAVLFANDGDRTTSGGDCGLAIWVFSTTGGLPGSGTLHLIS